MNRREKICNRPVLVYDHQTVDSVDFRQNNTNLSLKFGQALQENELLLYILSDREPSSLELVVDQSITLSHLWTTIKKQLSMDGEKHKHGLVVDAIAALL
jgi:hypothetical protein